MLTIESAEEKAEYFIRALSGMSEICDSTCQRQISRHPRRGALHVTTGQVRTSYWCAEAAQQISQYDQQAAFSLQEGRFNCDHRREVGDCQLRTELMDGRNPHRGQKVLA